jgi:acetoin utilization protein AcuB
MNLTVEEFTSINPATIHLNATLEEALRTMGKKGIRHLIVTEDANIVGIVSERDLLANYGKDWDQSLRIKDIMKTDVLFAYAKDSLSDVAYQLSKKKAGSAIVLEDDGSLYGIFTTTDALNALVELAPSDTEI